MTQLPPLPSFQQNDLAGFLGQLREYLLLSQEALAAHFFLDRSRISRYENNALSDKPKIGYLAGLAQLVAEQADDGARAQQILLRQVNEAVRLYYRRRRFVNWAALCGTAKTYRTKQRQTYAAKIAAQSAKSKQPSDWQRMLDSCIEPPAHTKLVGVETHLNWLIDALTKQGKPWLISVEGAGGLGKTALTTEAIQRPELSRPFQGVAWVSAQQRAFVPGSGLYKRDQPTLTVEGLANTLLGQLDELPLTPLSLEQKLAVLNRRFAETPHLIIIDNLETAADYEMLLPHLRKLANPSKVILTTRQSLQSYSDIACLSLSELKRVAALQLIRDVAQRQGPRMLASASEAQLQRIYNIVGGNPLALKLVVAQISALSLSEVLRNLTQIEDTDTDQLYDYLYRQAWQLLDAQSRKAWLMMLLAQNGTAAQLMAISQLKRPQLNQALQNLVRLCLVEAGGRLDERRYRIHRLTETFLSKELFENTANIIPDLQVQPDFFNTCLLRNLSFWQAWLQEQAEHLTALDNERDGVIRGISMALTLDDGWSIIQDLITELSPYMEARGYWDTWDSILHQAIEISHRRGEIATIAGLSALHARLLYRQGRYGDMVLRYQIAIKLARRAGGIFVAARACTNLGYYYIEHDARHWQRAEILCCYALEMFEQIGNAYGQAHTENHLGALYDRQGLWEKALSHLERACQLWQGMNNHAGLMFGYNNMGAVLNSTKRNDEALSHYRLALEQADLAGEVSFTGTIHMNMGNAYRSMNNLDQAEEHYHQAEEVFNQYANIHGRALLLSNMGLNLTQQGKRRKAKTYLDEALSLWQTLNDKYSEIQGMIYLLNYELALGHQAKAVVRLAQTERQLQETDPNQRYLLLRQQINEIRRSLSK